MKKVAFSLLCLSFFANTPLNAGFAEGEEAFNNQQYVNSFSEFQPLAEEGDFRSQYYMGYLYLNGYGVERNEQKALVYLQQAVDQNYDLAQALMAYLYFDGKVIKKDEKKALQLYQKAAEQGNVSALLNLGVLYYTGEGVSKNIDKAISYFNQIPLLQKPIVGRYLGDIYVSEKKDFKKALSYYMKAAREGDLPSYHALGSLYQKGEGIPADITEAIKYYKYAASQNYAPSQYALGIIYANGDDITRDRFEAYAWLSLAANQKLQVAEEGRQKLTDSMSLSDIEKGRRRLIELQQNSIGKTTSPFLGGSNNSADNTKVNAGGGKAQPSRKLRRRRR